MALNKNLKFAPMVFPLGAEALYEFVERFYRSLDEIFDLGGRALPSYPAPGH
jgi:hypothetical protein